jgi:hypothetical protein
MRRITIVIDCKKRHCGKCGFCRMAGGTVDGGRTFSCEVFREFLRADRKGRPKRCGRCLEDGQPGRLKRTEAGWGNQEKQNAGPSQPSV